MNTIHDIYVAEFKNLYAIEKQTLESLPTVLEAAKDKKLKKIIAKAHSKSEKHLKQVDGLLKEAEINPGGVVDSVLQEMLLNLREISNAKLPQDVKDIGIYCSLNRLFSYKFACYKNTKDLAKNIGNKEVKKELDFILDMEEKLFEKLNKKVRKSLLKKD